jgi:uncharacterized protein YcbK (DUF882 family)|tara:strand:+ start:13189 stop:13578 length:390 start_codon:yes stop_codon:yes gene_type:complete
MMEAEMSNWRHFTDKELACPCCRDTNMDVDFMDKLEVARVLAGIPFKITSGYRCEKYNAKITGGAPTGGAHSMGKAADIRCRTGTDRFKVVSAGITAGFEGIEVCDRHIHFDTKKRTHKNRVIWPGKSR